MTFFTTPYSKNIIATLRTVTIELTELIFLIIFHVMHNTLGTFYYHLRNRHHLLSVSIYHKRIPGLMKQTTEQ